MWYHLHYWPLLTIEQRRKQLLKTLCFSFLRFCVFLSIIRAAFLFGFFKILSVCFVCSKCFCVFLCTDKRFFLCVHNKKCFFVLLFSVCFVLFKIRDFLCFFLVCFVQDKRFFLCFHNKKCFFVLLFFCVFCSRWEIICVNIFFVFCSR